MPWSFSCSYPGIGRVYSVRYTTQIGIAPGFLEVECHPDSDPDPTGDFAFAVTDGTTTRTVYVPGCRLDTTEGRSDAGSSAVTYRLSDRRWTWLDRHQIDGFYNQQDGHNKLRPKWVRSPYQLAVLCTKAMGEPYPAAASAAIAGGILSVAVHDGGKGYTTPPAVTFGSGSPAAGTTAVGGGGVTGVTITTPGSGYTSPPTVSFVGGGGSGAAATATVANGRVVAVAVTNPGTGYSSAPTLQLVGGYGTGATGHAVLTGDAVSSVVVDTPGSGYAVPPLVFVAPPPGFAVDLPGGLAAYPSATVPAAQPADLLVDAVADFLKCGQNFTRSRTNPVTQWTATPAAVALARVAEEYARVPVLDPLTNFLSVQRLGAGTPLPAGRRLSSAPALTPPVVPVSITARGGPTKFQGRLRFRPVVGGVRKGEWDDPARSPLAPQLPAGRAMVARAQITDYAITNDYSLAVNGVTFTALAHATAADVYAEIGGAINASADPRVAGKVLATPLTSRLTIEGLASGYEFKVRGWRPERWRVNCPVGPVPAGVPQVNEWRVTYTPPAVWGPSDYLTLTVLGTTYASPTGLNFWDAVASVCDRVNGANVSYQCGIGGGGLVSLSGTAAGATLTVAAAVVSTGEGGVATAAETRPAASAAYGFHFSAPGTGVGARAVAEVSVTEAQAIVRETWCRTYQLVAEDASNPDNKYIPVPSAGNVTDRYRVHLLDSQVDQVVPRPGDAHVQDPFTFRPYAEDRYDGYSSDRQPAVYGSVNVLCWGGLLHSPVGGVDANTADGERVYVGFRVVDAEKGVIRFDRPVYRVYGRGNDAVFLPCEVVVETGYHLDDAATGGPVRYGVTVAVPGGTAPPVVRVYDDIRQGVVGEYDADHALTGWRFFDRDAEFRATTYATETAALYQYVSQQSVTYNNLELIGLSGLVRQVRWQFGRSGWGTVAGQNTEFAPDVLPYGERRHLENLPPDAQRALENLATQRFGQAVQKNAADDGRPRKL